MGLIRVAIALLMLAASIDGRSIFRNGTPIKRAHPRFVENLRSLGADVEWVDSSTLAPTRYFGAEGGTRRKT